VADSKSPGGSRERTAAGAASHGAANLRACPPHHLCEVLSDTGIGAWAGKIVISHLNIPAVNC
jgi:hypothetical protein